MVSVTEDINFVLPDYYFLQWFLLFNYKRDTSKIKFCQIFNSFDFRFKKYRIFAFYSDS